MSAEPVKIYAKGYFPEGEDAILGDCPFCHKVLLALETKNVDYTTELINLKAKPDWFLDMTAAGSVPVIKVGDKVITDSSDAIAYLEDSFPEPSMNEDATASVGAPVFGAFVQYFKAKGEAEAEKEATLKTELSVLNEYMGSMNGPFIGGATLNATDANLAPKLYHLKTALGHFKGFKLDAFPAVDGYLAAVMDTDAWKKTQYAPEIVIAGWAPKLEA